MIVIVLMNTYPLLVSEDLVFRSKYAALLSGAASINTAVTGLDELTEENVGAALTGVEPEGVSRAIVTDPYGRVLYDTREAGNATGYYVFYTELVSALQGSSAVYCVYKEGAFHSSAAQPVLYRNEIIGGVYVYEYDTQQASLLLTLQNNLMTISVGVAVLVLMLSLVFSRQITSRLANLLNAIRGVREGAYNQRAVITGHDEFTQIAGEFNDLVDRLQETEGARRQFVSDASHELKTPLAAIRLLTDSILQNENMEGETLREFVGDIGQEAERLSRITEDLLRLTRLDSGVIEAPSRVAVEAVLGRVEKMIRPVAEEKAVELITICPPGAAVIATEGEVHQILYNLMENAVKYNRRGGYVRVRVETGAETTALTVEDNGIGIPTGDLDNVFKRFYRVDKARSHRSGPEHRQRHRQPPGRGHPGREPGALRHPLHRDAPQQGGRGGRAMKKRAWTALVLAVTAALCACASPSEPETPEEGTLIYFLAPEDAVWGGDRVQGSWENLDLPEDAPSLDTARAVVARLLAGPESASLISPMPWGTTLAGLEIRDRRAYVDFEGNFGQLTGVDLALADYCLTLSLTALEGISAVSVTVQGRPVGQQPKQVFYERDVLLSTMGDVLQRSEVTLFFLNSEGALAGEKRVLELYEGQTLAESLLDALLDGPEDRELTRIIPEDFQINFVRVDSGICSLSIAAASLEALPEDPAVQQNILASLTRSLYSAGTIEKIRFLSGGEELTSFGQVPVEAEAVREPGGLPQMDVPGSTGIEE